MQINVAITVLTPDGNMNMVVASASEAIPYYESGTPVDQFDQVSLVVDRLVDDCHSRAKEQVQAWRTSAERSQ